MDKMTKVALITGAARRVGAVIAEYLHSFDYRVVIHCHQSIAEAKVLTEMLNEKRPDSACFYAADLRKIETFEPFLRSIIERWQRLDVLVNNASIFYPTILESSPTFVWDDLINCNAKAPFFLSQAAYPYLKENQGNIINITDVHAEKTLKNYGIYSMSKALLLHQTKCLAREWGPDVRVNAVAPGAVLWPEGENILDPEAKKEILSQTVLKKQVNPISIAKAVMSLLENEDITGDVIHVSAGRGI